jgi:signal transduction histidine kinase
LRTSSIQRRLVAAVVLTQLLLAVGLVFVGVYFTRRQLRTAFDAGLHGRAMSVAALVRYSEEPHPVLIFDRELAPPPLDRGHPDFYQIIDADHHVIAASPNWPSEFNSVPRKGRSYWSLSLQGAKYRAVRLENVPVLDRESADVAPDAKLTVIYAAPTEELGEVVWRAGLFTGLASLALLGISTAIAVGAIRRGLAPLQMLASSAAAVSPANWELHTPAEASSTLELAPLTQAMTAMLANLRQAFTSQREFLANAAHELKTPAAILKSTLQSLVQRPRSSDEYRAGIEAALEDMARLEKLLHSMLRLARAEQWAMGSLRPDLGEVDLSTSCELCVERLLPLADQRGVKVELRNEGSPTLKADAEDLELVWSNLLENAIQYSPAGSKVTVSVQGNGDFAEVAVKDEGPGISEAEITQIFERFHRGDASRARETGGYGLGLAISKAIVEAYGGSVTAESQLGEGTKMIARLPVTS